MFILGLVLILTCAALFVYFGNKKIAERVYTKTVLDFIKADPAFAKKSPYRIVRIKSEYSTDYRYYIYKGKVRVDNNWHYKPKEAQDSLNELEKLEGYDLTKIF